MKINSVTEFNAALILLMREGTELQAERELVMLQVPGM